jgi:phenylpropionate dioxygenase-like ring-hydroxylating dioxygenase large terminal subunit
MPSPAGRRRPRPSRSAARPDAAADTRAEEGRGLPPVCYTSPEVYALEVERIFRREWLCIGRADEVAAPGDYLTLDLLGEPLILVRDGAGAVRVLSAICRHRAMPVATGAGHTRTFVCPYHNWTYALDGRLLGAPEMTASPGFDPAGCRLPTLRSEVWEGFVFASFDPDAPPLGPALAPLSPLVQPYGLVAMKTVKSVPFDMECAWNWKLMCENFMEPYHHLGTHRKSLEPLMPARLSQTLGLDGPFSVVHMYYRERDGSADPAGWGVPSLPLITGLGPEERRRVTLLHVYPLGLITLLADHAEFYRVFPEGPARVRLEKLICVPPDVPSRPTFESEVRQVIQGFLEIRDEDVAICRAVQRGLGSRFAERGQLSHLEKAIGQFARYVTARIGAP